MLVLRQSTSRVVPVFMAASSDHVTGKTGLTLTIELKKYNAAFASISPTVVERTFGWYDVTLTTAHLDTLGSLVLHATGSAADPSDVPMQVVAYDPNDAGSLGLSSSAVFSIVSPFDPTTGKLTLTRGDDYKAGHKVRLPAFTSSNWDNLTGATCTFTVRLNPVGDEEDEVLLTLTDTTAARVAGAGVQSLTFEPLARPGSPVVNNQVGGTHYLVPGRAKGKWDIQAVLADGSPKTLATGLVDVVEDQTRDVAP